MQIGSHVWVMGDASCFVDVVKDEAGVDGAGTGCAGETVERGEIHGGVEGLAVLDGTCGCAGPEV